MSFKDYNLKNIQKISQVRFSVVGFWWVGTYLKIGPLNSYILKFGIYSKIDPKFEIEMNIYLLFISTNQHPTTKQFTKFIIQSVETYIYIKDG